MRKKSSVNLDKCILCQKMIRSEYLSCPRKKDGGSDNQAYRVLSLTAQEQELFKYTIRHRAIEVSRGIWKRKEKTLAL